MNYMSAPNSRWLWGARAIAKHIGRTERQTFHMLSQGSLPAQKIGGHYVADPDVLDAFLRGGNGVKEP